MSDEVKEADPNITSPFIFPKKWRWMPPHPVAFDRSHPLGRHAVAAIVPAWGNEEGVWSVGQRFFFEKYVMGTGALDFGIQHKNYSPWVGNAGSLYIDPSAEINSTKLYNAKSGSSGFEFANNADWTIVGIAYVEGDGRAGTASDPRWYSQDQGDSSNDHDLMIGIANVGDAPRARIRLNGSTQTMIPDANGIQDNALNLIAAGIYTTEAGQAIPWAGHLREDGLFDNTVGSGQATGYDQRELGTLNHAQAIGATATSSLDGNPFNGNIIGIFFFNTTLYGQNNLVDLRLKDFFTNPWEIFEPRKVMVSPPQRKGPVYDADLDTYREGPVAKPVIQRVRRKPRWDYVGDASVGSGGSETELNLTHGLDIREGDLVFIGSHVNASGVTAIASTNYTGVLNYLLNEYEQSGQTQTHSVVWSQVPHEGFPATLNITFGAAVARNSVVLVAYRPPTGRKVKLHWKSRLNVEGIADGSLEQMPVLNRVTAGSIYFGFLAVDREFNPLDGVEAHGYRLTANPASTQSQAFVHKELKSLELAPVVRGAGSDTAWSMSALFTAEKPIILPPNEEEYDQIMTRKPGVRRDQP